MMRFVERPIAFIQRAFHRAYLTGGLILPRLFGRFSRSDTLLILIAAGIGLASGAAILLFNWTVEFAGVQFAQLFEFSHELNWWQLVAIPLIPALGGLGVGMLQVYVFRSSPGHGVPEVILASRFSRGTVQTKTIFQKLVTASLSIASGGGGGREGPIVHVGAAVGNSIARMFGLTSDQSRTLIACGAAAGISGIFNAPIGGVMFVLEVILGDFRLKTFTPVVVASVVATALTRNFYGDTTLVNAPQDFSIAPLEFGLFILLGLLLGIASAGFTKTIITIERWFRGRFNAIPALKPAIGGLLAGACILFLPELMEQSYSPINSALHAQLPVWILLIVAVVKPAHTACTIGSGGTGGVFAPALKSGAMLGAAFGTGAMVLFPNLVTTPTAYALCGMGALLAATMHAPLTAVLMVIEISDGYAIVLPAMLTAILSTIIAQRFIKSSIYTYNLTKEGTTLGSYAYIPQLHEMPIAAIIDRNIETVQPRAPLRTILRIFEESKHEAIIVTGSDGAYRGLIDFDDVRACITETSSIDSLIAMDVLTVSVKPVSENTTLDVVLNLFDEYGWDVLPVLSASGSSIPVGVVTAHQAQRFYRKSVAREM